jgi:hypothetical protein
MIMKRIAGHTLDDDQTNTTTIGTCRQAHLHRLVCELLVALALALSWEPFVCGIMGVMEKIKVSWTMPLCDFDYLGSRSVLTKIH